MEQNQRLSTILYVCLESTKNRVGYDTVFEIEKKNFQNYNVDNKAECFANLNTAYFSGDEIHPASEEEGLSLWDHMEPDLTIQYIGSIVQDAENHRGDYHGLTVRRHSVISVDAAFFICASNHLVMAEDRKIPKTRKVSIRKGDILTGK